MKIGNALGKDIDGLLYKEDSYLVSNIDAVGVEIELENIKYDFVRDRPDIPHSSRFHVDPGINLPSIAQFWRVVKDGSLRNGSEFIFKDPLIGANITSALDSFQEFLNVFRFKNKKVSVTDRCSVHVHLDVRDLDNNELDNLILLYIFLERVLFTYINPFRIKNNYCRPLTDSAFRYTMKTLLKSNKYDDAHDNIRELINSIRANCDKYSALNILPVSTYGSVEFRHHQGTDNMDEIKEWVNIILAIKVASRNNSINDYLTLYKESGVIGIIHSIFGNIEKVYDFFMDNEKYHTIDECLFKGMLDVREILNMETLDNLTNNHIRSKVRPVNTLLYQFKKTNGLIKEETI